MSARAAATSEARPIAIPNVIQLIDSVTPSASKTPPTTKNPDARTAHITPERADAAGLVEAAVTATAVELVPLAALA